MIGSTDLFGNDNARAFARREDPDTSRDAAAGITLHLRELQRQVLAFAEARGRLGFIDPDMAAHFECHGSTYRTRRSELVEMGLIADTCERRPIVAAGRKHAVWAITDKGRGKAARIGLHLLDHAA